MAKTVFQNEVIDRIRQIRTERNISQIALANIIDVSNGQIGNIESPRFRHKYTLKQLYAISKKFNLTLDYLLTGKEERLSTEELVLNLIKYDE